MKYRKGLTYDHTYAHIYKFGSTQELSFEFRSTYEFGRRNECSNVHFFAPGPYFIMRSRGLYLGEVDVLAYTFNPDGHPDEAL